MRRVVVFAGLLLGCSDSSVSFDAPESGGSNPSSGTTVSSGGADTQTTGGTRATGGVVTTGGSIATGGAVATGGKATGGSATGGVVTTGGATAPGGAATGGVIATGGTTCDPNIEPAPVACQLRGTGGMPCADQPCAHTICLVQSITDVGYCTTEATCTLLNGELWNPDGKSPSMCIVN